MVTRLIKHTLLAAGLLSLAGAASADKIRWLNDWLPAGDKAVIYLAVQEGLFAAEGIEVEIMSGRGSSDVVTKLATNAADMGTGALGALLQAKAEQTVPVTAVASIYTKQPDAILVDAASDITSLQDLKGKTLATPTFSGSNVIWPLVLRANDMQESDVNLLKIDPGAMGPMMSTGRVDGTINWITKLPAYEDIMAQAGKSIRVLPWSDFGFDGYGLSVFASDRLIRTKPELVEKVVRIYAQATQMAAENPELAGRAIKAMVSEIDERVATAEFAASVPLINNEISDANGHGNFETELLNTTWKWVAEAQGLSESAIDPSDAVTNRFVSQ